MSSIRLSIVVAVYNIEDYVVECVESFFDLDVNEDVEIIFINDGSTDNSLINLKKVLFKKKLNNIKVVDQKNTGVSDLRNQGIRLSSGRYVTFVDGDDFIKVKELIDLFNVGYSEDCDVIIGNFFTYEQHEKNIRYSPKYNIVKNKILGKDLLINHLLIDMTPSVWKGIYKKSFIEKENLWFMSGVQVGEDFNWMFKILLRANSVYVDNVYYYIYRIRPGSVIRSDFNLKKYEGILNLVEDNVNFIESRGEYDKRVIGKLNEKLVAILARGVALYQGKHDIARLRLIISKLGVDSIRFKFVLKFMEFSPSLFSKIFYLKYKGK
ncbi:glycosyltransferase [Acinetobacter junii]|uniref:Glycosyltransferase n=1 Tax=Acinetobacter junii TaxID=40215 RepID=A0A8F6MJ87_ACIJU|nr:glycosyltransferase [Acinetobacter junii]MDH1003634.1 glycosyltransferase [Acinetobacter junii]QXR27848.1 glycosyltransferase [Acinetobacter junii]